jgi:hypothetical protein
MRHSAGSNETMNGEMIAIIDARVARQLARPLTSAFACAAIGRRRQR